jgi:hypothetical protein
MPMIVGSKDQSLGMTSPNIMQTAYYTTIAALLES